jgi:hypothetical protein
MKAMMRSNRYLKRSMGTHTGDCDRETDHQHPDSELRRRSILCNQPCSLCSILHSGTRANACLAMFRLAVDSYDATRGFTLLNQALVGKVRVTVVRCRDA